MEFPNRQSNFNFFGTLEICNFQDMGFEGYLFTWSNGREVEANIQLRLDRAFGSEKLCLKFSFYKVVHGSRFGSDHTPLLIELNATRPCSTRNNKIFRFEESWTKDPSCTDCIKSFWQDGDNWSTNLTRVKKGLSHANLMGVTDFRKKIQHLERALEISQNL